MPRVNELRPEFVEFAPKPLEEGVLYISCQNLVMLHLCCCGCGNKVVTPLSPTGWELRFNGDRVTLFPSIGNWKLPCQSHYWIRGNKVRWAPKLSEWEISEHYAANQRLRDRYFDGGLDLDDNQGADYGAGEKRSTEHTGLIARIRKWLS
jgi:hypothetical protein